MSELNLLVILGFKHKKFRTILDSNCFRSGHAFSFVIPVLYWYDFTLHDGGCGGVEEAGGWIGRYIDILVSCLEWAAGGFPGVLKSRLGCRI